MGFFNILRDYRHLRDDSISLSLFRESADIHETTLSVSQNLEIFVNHIHHVLFLVVFHNLFAYVLGFYTAKVFKLDKKNCKTIAIETGIQNGGLGLLLIFSFFDGLGGMALLAAFWGIWDVFSGMTLAYYWGKNKNLIKSI